MTVIFVALIIALIVSRTVFSIIISSLRKEKLGYDERKSDDDNYGRYEREEYGRKSSKVEEIEKKVRRTNKVISIAICIAMLITVAISSIYVIGEQNLAIVTTFGKAEAVSGTGMHFKIPFIQKVKKFDSTIQGFAIGYQEEDNETQETDSLMITTDFNFVNVDFYVEYRINDAIMYEYGSSDPVEILRNIAQASIRNTIGSYNVDDVLTTGKSEIQAAIKEDIIKELENRQTGLMLVNVTIQDAEPPTTEVSQAFKSVENAKQQADTSRNTAKKYQNEQIPKATAEADAIIQEANATKQERINEANGEVALFNAMYEEYKKDPDTSKIRMYYEAMEELMPNLQIIVNGTDSEIKPIIVQQEATKQQETTKQQVTAEQQETTEQEEN